MTIAEKIVEEARSWKGTRFQHQGRLKGVGIDCVGFISEVAREAGVLDLEIPSNYRPREDGVIMLRLLREHMELVSDMQPGDVLALIEDSLANPNVPRHLAIITEIRPRTMFIIHASEHGVREHRTDTHWLQRIHSVWRVKND